jgi:hypothetical protein
VRKKARRTKKGLPRFMRIEHLKKLLFKWDDCRDIILQAYDEEGIKGVMELTWLQREGVRRVLVRLGILPRRKSDKNVAEMIARQEKANRIHLLHWGWSEGQDTIVLGTCYNRVADCLTKCGSVFVKKGHRYKQYPLPRGDVRAYMEENGTKYFQAGDLRLPVSRVKDTAILPVRC